MPRGRQDVWPVSYGHCRFCQASAPHGEMVHYAVRHWAHPVCLYKSKGLEALNALHTWQIRRLPVLPLMKAGVPVEQIHAWGARIEEEDRQRENETKTSRTTCS